MENQRKGEPNRDPISGAPGAHPVGTAAGAVLGGAAAGAATGTVAGPVGTAIGAAVGAVVGGLGGKAVAEHFDPTVVDDHWRTRYEREPYYRSGTTYDDYAPAYRLGAESRMLYGDKTFDETEDLIATRYNDVRGTSRLDWDDARPAASAAWKQRYL